MTMSVIKPVVFSPEMMISTTAIEEHPDWLGGTSYNKGDIVVHIDPGAVNIRRWESLINSNLTEPSSAAVTEWLDIGPCNSCAMFDSFISTQTFAESPLVVVLEPGQIVTTMAFLNLFGTSIQVEILTDEGVVYDSTQSLSGAIIADWWDYYFLEDDQVTQAFFNDLPLYYGAQIRITMLGGTVAIGHAVFGTSQDLGCLSMGATSGIIDYSRKVTDEFGTTEFLRRTFADEMSGQILVENGQLNRLKRLFRDLRATPCLWIGTPDPEYAETLIVYGWYRQHRIAINYPRHSLIDIEIEGLT